MKGSLHTRPIPIEPSLDVVACRVLDRGFVAGCGFLGADGSALHRQTRRVKPVDCRLRPRYVAARGGTSGQALVVVRVSPDRAAHGPRIVQACAGPGVWPGPADTRIGASAAEHVGALPRIAVAGGLVAAAVGD